MVLAANGPFYSNSAPAAALQACIFLNSAFRVHIISRQMKYVKHMEFSNVFLFQESFTVYTPNLFCPFDHLPNTVTTQSTYLICLYSLTLNLT